MKLYYDDERIATLMRDWFDVQFIDNMDFDTMQRPTKWHIAETSHHIFEPQVGDLVRWKGTGNAQIAIERKMPHMLNHINDIEIIQRNGKPFFTPLREE